MKSSSMPGLGSSLSRMFLLSLLLVVAIGLSFLWKTERQFLIQQSRERAVLVLEIIEESLLRYQEELPTTQAMTDWFFPLNQLAERYHLSISLVGENSQQLKFNADQKLEKRISKPYYSWFADWFSLEPIIIERTIPTQFFFPVKVVIEVKPSLDFSAIKQRMFTFLILMVLLAVLVYAAIKIITVRMFNELGVINRAIKQIETDHYNVKLPDFYFSELADISDSYNQATDRLEKLRHENRALAERLLWLQEEERQYLAQELHDELGQSISAIKVICVSMQKSSLELPQQTSQKNNLRLPGQCQSITDICDHLYTVVRDLMKRLRPTVLDELGLKAALEEVVNSWRERQIDLDIRFNCEDSVEQCNDSAKINVYRIVQESLTNIVKHADASHIEINLREFHDRSKPWTVGRFYQLDIVDNGKGFNSADKRFGFGLVGMRERVKSMGGRLTIDSKPGAGTTITVQVPLTKGFKE